MLTGQEKDAKQYHPPQHMTFLKEKQKPKIRIEALLKGPKPRFQLRGKMAFKPSVLGRVLLCGHILKEGPSYLQEVLSRRGGGGAIIWCYLYRERGDNLRLATRTSLLCVGGGCVGFHFLVAGGLEEIEG